jgi:hypothetical protein
MAIILFSPIESNALPSHSFATVFLAPSSILFLGMGGDWPGSFSPPLPPFPYEEALSTRSSGHLTLYIFPSAPI